MPKVQKINKAGKDYPEFGIKKGETEGEYGQRLCGQLKEITLDVA